MTEISQNLLPKMYSAMAQLNKIILGKEHEIKLATCCIVANGHLLLEDLPGNGKTMLAHSFSKVFGLEYKRVQFTNDLLPTDITGVSIYNRDSNEFVFKKGPIFTQMMLADEINRATPKSQSALLEAMEEYQVTVEGHTYMLDGPFFVIATQNPIEQQGTYPLPEAQLDRFLMKLSLGYPSKEAEIEILNGADRRQMLLECESLISANELLEIQQQVSGVYTSESLLRYIYALIEYTRTSGKFSAGLSPRAGLSLVRAAKSWALIEGRDSVIPADVQMVFKSIAVHRLVPIDERVYIQQIIDLVEIP